MVEIIIGIAMLSYLVYSIIILNGVKKGYHNVNQNYLDLIPSMFTTIGILGTFGGIAVGLLGFESTNIEGSIPQLLDGLKTAFYASIVGISLSIIFSKVIAFIKNKNEKGVLSEETLAINNLLESIRDLKNDFSSTDDNGNTIKPGNVFRDMYKESVKQSNSLQTFSADLAGTIEAGFYKILNDPSEGVVAELKLLQNAIDNLGTKISENTGDGMERIVSNLENSISRMIEEFKTSISGDTKNEMERLAQLLGQAGGSLNDFPDKLQIMTDNLNENFKGLQDVIAQISKQTLLQSEESTNHMKQQIGDMSEVIKNIGGDFQSGQQTLLTEQSKNLQVSESLLSAFNTSIEKMNEVSGGVNSSITKLNEAQAGLTTTVTNFRSASQEINLSSNKFGESQLTFSKYSNEFLQKNSTSIIEIQKSLETAKGVSTDYANKFEIIEKGLEGIFSKIEKGLDLYKNTILSSVQEYLTQYTTALTDSAKSLRSVVEIQNESITELAEEISRLKR
jgi:ABC-type transporter Mla subunit MlaD